MLTRTSCTANVHRCLIQPAVNGGKDAVQERYTAGQICSFTYGRGPDWTSQKAIARSCLLLKLPAQADPGRGISAAAPACLDYTQFVRTPARTRCCEWDWPTAISGPKEAAVATDTHDRLQQAGVAAALMFFCAAGKWAKGSGDAHQQFTRLQELERDRELAATQNGEAPRHPAIAPLVGSGKVALSYPAGDGDDVSLRGLGAHSIQGRESRPKSWSSCSIENNSHVCFVSLRQRRSA